MNYAFLNYLINNYTGESFFGFGLPVIAFLTTISLVRLLFIKNRTTPRSRLVIFILAFLAVILHVVTLFWLGSIYIDATCGKNWACGWIMLGVLGLVVYSSPVVFVLILALLRYWNKPGIKPTIPILSRYKYYILPVILAFLVFTVTDFTITNNNQKHYNEAITDLLNIGSNFSVRDKQILEVAESDFTKSFIENYDKNHNSTTFKEDIDTCKYVLLNQTLTKECQKILLGSVEQEDKERDDSDRVDVATPIPDILLDDPYLLSDKHPFTLDQASGLGSYVIFPVFRQRAYYINKILGGYGFSSNEELLIIFNRKGEIVKSFSITDEKRPLFAVDVDKDGTDEIIYLNNNYDNKSVVIGAWYFDKTN